MDLNMSGTVEVTLDTGEKYTYDEVTRVENIDGEVSIYVEDGPTFSFGPGVWDQVIPSGP